MVCSGVNPEPKVHWIPCGSSSGKESGGIGGGGLNMRSEEELLYCCASSRSCKHAVMACHNRFGKHRSCSGGRFGTPHQKGAELSLNTTGSMMRAGPMVVVAAVVVVT